MGNKPTINNLSVDINFISFLGILLFQCISKCIIIVFVSDYTDILVSNICLCTRLYSSDHCYWSIPDRICEPCDPPNVNNLFALVEKTRLLLSNQFRRK